MSSHHSRSSSPEPSQKTSDLSLIEDLLAQQQRLKPKMVVGNDTITTTTTEDHLLSNSIVPATTSTSSTSSYSFNDEQEVSVFTEEFYSNVLEEGEGDESGMYMSMQATESASDLTEIKLLLLRQEHNNDQLTTTSSISSAAAAINNNPSPARIPTKSSNTTNTAARHNRDLLFDPTLWPAVKPTLNEATANNSINNIHALIKNTDILGRSEEQIREIQRSVSSIDALLSTRNIQQQQQQQQQNILELDYADANESYSNNETNQSSFIEVYTDADRDTRRKILEMERTISRLESTIQAINSSASLNSFGAGDRVAFGRNSDIVDDESGQGRQDQQQSSLSRSKQYNSSSSSSQSHPIAATTTTTTSIVNPPILSDQVKKFIQEEMDKMYQKMRQENMVESKPSLSTSSHLKQIDAALSSLQEQVSGFVSSNKKHLETESKSKSSSSSNNHADLKDEVHRLQQKFKSMQDELDNIESGISSKFACNDVQQLDNYNHLQLQINSLKRLITDTASNTPHQSPKSTAANTSETNRSNPFTLPSLSKQIKSLEQDLKQRISSTKLSLETESRSRLRDVRKEVDDLKTKYSSSKLNDIIRGIVEEMQQSLLKQITINQEKTDKFQEKITTNQEFIINERKQIRKLMEASRGEIAVRLVEIRRDAVQIAAEVEARLQNKIEEVQAGRLEGSQETKKQSQKQKKEQQQRDGPPVIAAVEVEKKSKDFSGIIADISKLKEKQQQLSKKLDAKIDAVVIEELMRHIATRDELKKLIAKSLSNAANEATKSHHSTKIYSERLEHMATKIKHVETETERLRRDMSSLSYDALSAKLNSMNHDLEVKFNDLAQDLANSFKDADWDGEDGEEEDRVDGGGGGGDHDHVSSSSSTSSSSSPLPNGHASSPPQSFGGLVGGKKSLGGHKQRKQQTHNQGEDRLTKLIRKRVNQVVSEKASALDRYSNRELQGYYEEVAETMTRRLTRDFDEKLYLVCSDLSACKMAWQLSEKRPLQQCALWLWKSATLKLGSAVPWNVEARNTDPENFKWESDSIFIRIEEAGLYEIAFAFFTKCKPSIQLVVNGESVMTAINSSSYVVHHGSGFVLSGHGKMEPGCVSGLSLLDFLALPPKSTLAVHYHNGKRNALGHGFFSIRKM